MSIPHGAGAIVSTPSDLVKFISALFTGQLISEKSLNQMKTIKDGMGMGMGMQQFPYENKKVYGHAGSIDGFGSMLCYFPDDKLAVSYCSNGTLYSSPQIPLKLTITKNEGKLYGQGTGQPAFPLEPSAKNEFKFELAGIVIHFNPEKAEFVLEQGGGKFTFTLEK